MMTFEHDSVKQLIYHIKHSYYLLESKTLDYATVPIETHNIKLSYTCQNLKQQ